MISTSQIKTIIIEDNQTTQKLLRDSLEENFSDLLCEGIASSIKEAVNLIVKIEPELVFMDIELKDGLAFEIFDKITPNFEVIFITGFRNHLERALEHFALNYITKPIDVQKLIKTVKHYISLRQRLFSIEKLQLTKGLINNKDGKLFIQTNNEHKLLNTMDIVKIVADGNYSSFYLEDGTKHLVSKGVLYYEQLLPETSFFRASRSVLINIHFIKSIYKKETIILVDKEHIHVSTRNKSKLIHLIGSIS